MKSKEQIEKLKKHYMDMGTDPLNNNEDKLRIIAMMVSVLNWVLRDED